MAKAVIAIHGGAGAITRAAMSAEKEQYYRQQLAAIVSAGQQILASGGKRAGCRDRSGTAAGRVPAVQCRQRGRVHPSGHP
jgi:asparaginase (EC 3.5.1.1)